MTTAIRPDKLLPPIAFVLTFLALSLPTGARSQSEAKLEIVPQFPHSFPVSSVAFSPDGARVLSGSLDKTVKLWDAATGTLIRTFEGHLGSVTSVAFSPGAARVLSGSVDKTIKLWDLSTGQLLRTFAAQSQVWSVAFSPDGTRVLSGGGVSVSSLGEVNLWDASTGQLVRTFAGHSHLVWSVAFSPDGDRVLSGDTGDGASIPGALKLWDSATGTLIRNFEGHSKGVSSVAFSPDGAHVLSGGLDSPGALAKLWDTATGALLRTFDTHTGWVRSVAFSPDGARILLGGVNKTMELWDAATSQLLGTFDGHSGDILSVVFSHDGARVLSGGGGEIDTSSPGEVKLWEIDTSSPGEVKLWDLATGRILRTFEGHSDAVRSVAFSPDGTRVLSGNGQYLGNDTTMKLWDAASGRLMHVFQGHTEAVRSVAFSPDGGRVISGSGSDPEELRERPDETMKLWDAASGRLLRTFERTFEGHHSEGFTSVAFSPDGARVLSGSVDSSTIMLWDAATGALIRTFEGHSSGVSSLAFSSNGARMLSGSSDKTIKLWDVATGAVLRSFEGDSEWVFSVAFSRNGARLLSGGADNTLKLWDADSGALVRTFEGHSDTIHSVSFSPDGTRALSGSYDRTIKLWDVATGRLLRTFQGHSVGVSSVGFSPDARRIVSGGWDATIRIWDADTGQLLVTLTATPSGNWLAITPEGFYAASPGGGNLLAVVRGLEVFSVDQFYPGLYRPDLVREKLTGDPSGKVREAATTLDLRKLLDRGRNPPTFEITSPPDKSHASASPINLHLKVDANADPIEGIEVFVNGRQATTPGLRSATSRMATAPTLERSLEVPLEQGENQIRIVARNKVGQTVHDFILFRDKPDVLDKSGTLYVLAIGVDKYPQLPPTCGPTGNQSCDLRFASRDARAFRDVLMKHAGPLYGDVKSMLLARDGDKPPTKVNVEDALQEMLGKAGAADTTVLFIAGHGTTEGRGADYMFLPEGAEFVGQELRRSTVVPWNTFQLALQNTLGRRLMFADTCHSGGAYNARLVNDAANANIIVFSATDTETLSWEFENLEHGVFTYALIQGLEGKARRPDGTVSVLALGDYISGEVSRLTQEKQQPTFHISGTKNFILAKQ